MLVIQWHLQGQNSKVNSNVKNVFFCYQKVVDYFFWGTEKFISDIILMVQWHWQGQKINIKGHFQKYILTNTITNKLNT